MSLKCNFCGKIYKTIQSKSNHIKKFHQNIINTTPIKTYKCRKCDKIYKHLQSRFTHEKSCNSTDIIQKYDEIKKELDDIKKNISININNGVINNNSNNTNNINIFGIGDKHIIKLLNNSDKRILYNTVFDELPLVNLIKKIYNDDNLKENRNAYVPNLQNNHAFLYDSETKKFNAMNKNDLVNQIIHTGEFEIRTLYNDCKNFDINEKLKDKMSEYLEELRLKNNEHSDFIKKHNEEIIYILYNARDFMKKIFDTTNLQ